MQERERIAAVLQLMSTAAVAAATRAADATIRELAGDELLGRVRGEL
jgi:hypothetical protein